MLDVFDEDPLADRLSQLGRIRETWSFSEIALRAAAALADRCLNPPLLVNQRPHVIAFERSSFETSDGIAQGREHPSEPLVGRRGRSGSPQCTCTPPFRPAQYFHRASRVECEVQAEVGELRNRRGGSHAQLGRPQRRPVVLGDLEPGPECREGARTVARCKAAQRVAVPATYALRGRSSACTPVDTGHQ